MQSFPTSDDKDLIKAISLLNGKDEIAGFLRDICTPGEIEELSRRFQIATLLWRTKLSYLEIAKKMNTSTTTVTRVSQWLFKESWGGYRAALKKMYGKSVR
jgi:TrpR-related protein YerC/YecD